MPIMRTPGQRLDIETETRIVAYVARGDKLDTIQAATGATHDTIRAVRRRNKENLAIISQRMQAKAEEDALSIKQKANTLIAKRLDKVDNTYETMDKAREDWLKDKITWKEYEAILRRCKEVSLGELVNVSKEMHAQSNTPDAPPANPQDLSELAAAIRSGDEVRVTQAIFNPKSKTDAQPS